MDKVYIIDPASTEWNRGSFCYLPYLFYDALKWGQKKDIYFLENYTAADVEQIEGKSPEIYVALWSPTQKSICLELYRTFPQAKFFGYYGFMKQYGFPIYHITKEQILDGMKWQGLSFINLKSVLLSDCDSHLQGKYKGQWYPFHTSYGCPRGCSFCPASKNNEGQIYKLPVWRVKEKLEYYQTLGYNNIHFTDEDLFLDIDRAADILNICKQLGEDNTRKFNLIALTHSFSVLKFIEKYRVDSLTEAGIRLLEVGYEGGTLLSEKGTHHQINCITLWNLCPDLVYFLTMTFAPGETIKTLNKTGQFLKQFGKKPEELVPRLRTNGTEGGLGQFFQPYPGLIQKRDSIGYFSPFEYTRLYPNFIPHSFLDSKIKRIDINEQQYINYKKWCELYNIKPFAISQLFRFTNKSIREYIDGELWIQKAENAINLAIAARLGIIQ